MFHIILYQPEIPPNTGNIIRLCANTGAHLHLIHPLGFTWDDKRIKRAGLDYHEFSKITHYDDFEIFTKNAPCNTLYALSTKGERTHYDPNFKSGDAFIFGPETRGLPEAILKKFPKDHLLRIPMRPESRSLNLSNATAIMLYEAIRQVGLKCA